MLREVHSGRGHLAPIGNRRSVPAPMPLVRSVCCVWQGCSVHLTAASPGSCACFGSPELQTGRAGSERIVLHQICTAFIDFPPDKTQACKRPRSGARGQPAQCWGGQRQGAGVGAAQRPPGHAAGVSPRSETPRRRCPGPGGAAPARARTEAPCGGTTPPRRTPPVPGPSARSGARRAPSPGPAAGSEPAGGGSAGCALTPSGTGTGTGSSPAGGSGSEQPSEELRRGLKARGVRCV